VAAAGAFAAAGMRLHIGQILIIIISGQRDLYSVASVKGDIGVLINLKGFRL